MIPSGLIFFNQFNKLKSLGLSQPIKLGIGTGKYLFYKKKFNLLSTWSLNSLYLAIFSTLCDTAITFINKFKYYICLKKRNPYILI